MASISLNPRVDSLVQPHVYQGVSEIRFYPDEKLYVEIFTPRLYIRSVQPSDIDNYADLYGDAEVMEKFHDGKTKSREYIKDRIENLWDKRWRELDPYSAFAVFHRTTGEFLGHIVLGHGDNPGESEIAGLCKKEFWNQHYASEAMEAILKEYAPATVQEGYLLEGKPLQRIGATTRSNEPAPTRILEKFGMQLQKTEEKFGALRNHYSLDITHLPVPTLQKTTNEFLKFAIAQQEPAPVSEGQKA